MKKILEQFAAYNYWANMRITDAVNNLTDEQLHREITSSFSSIYKTLLHLWDVEDIWWQRMKLTERTEWQSTTFTGSVVELSKSLVLQSKLWKEWIDLATEEALNSEFNYTNRKNNNFTQPISEMLAHLFNHQSYHRGQLVTMLRQVGYTSIPNSDMISFLRKK
jgi:uncharacterized damage-inducible protein DinB